MEGWFRGDGALARIPLLADRFRELLLEETRQELGEHFLYYVPWMAVRSKCASLRSLMKEPLPAAPPTLLTSQPTLQTLTDVFNDPASHSLGAIVPYDLKARIDTAFDGRDGQFVQALEGAKKLLASECPWIHTLLTRIVSYVVPITHRPEGRPVKRGFSTPLCYGAVFLTFEDRAKSLEEATVELAIDLAHEVGHHSLHTYQTADPVLQSDLRAPIYSGVKQIERPAIMSLHASAALLFMIEASARLATNRQLAPIAREHAAKRFTWMIGQQRMALDAIQNKVVPTTLGAHIIKEMEEQLTEVQSLDVS